MPRVGAAGKRDPAREAEAQKWIEEITKQKFTASFEDYLRDGIVLCNLMNTLKPGSVKKINPAGSTTFKLIENISQFLKAATEYGVNELDLFQSVDLMEKKDIACVTNMLFQLGGCTYKHPEWNGPRIGNKTSDENVREFSEDTIAEQKKVIGLQAGSNKGASQSGQSFGNARHVIIGK